MNHNQILKAFNSFLLLFLSVAVDLAQEVIHKDECVRVKRKLRLRAINLEYVKHTKLKFVASTNNDLWIVSSPVCILENRTKSGPSAFWEYIQFGEHDERFQTKNRSLNSIEA